MSSLQIHRESPNYFLFGSWITKGHCLIVLTEPDPNVSRHAWLYRLGPEDVGPPIVPTSADVLRILGELQTAEACDRFLNDQASITKGFIQLTIASLKEEYL